MPWGLERWHGGHDLHFITFSCYGRQPLLASACHRELFLKVLEEVRRRHQWVVIGYVVMPEHVHLLVSEPHERPLATAIQALKLGFARRVLAEERRHRPGLETRETQGTRKTALPHHVWQARYYDFNVCTPAKRVEKLRYMHRNPVRRGLVAAPELWPWSSFRAYAYQERGLVRVNEWGVVKMKFVQPTAFPH
ncbi:MAG: transposase [Candidatus Korobacteraceae bacterium]